jgi:CheY-like chemotaxis protein
MAAVGSAVRARTRRLVELGEHRRSDVDHLPGDNSSGIGLKVLIVDDNVDSATSFAMLCQIDGHEVRTAHDGAEGLAFALEFEPDAVFLDISLPDMNGYHVAEQMRRNPSLDKTLLVAMTGYGDAEHAHRSQEAGFDHHLVKPADHTFIKQLLERRRSAAGCCF